MVGGFSLKNDMAHYIDSEKDQQLKRLEKLGINIDGQTFEQAINTLISIVESIESEKLKI